MATPKGMRAVVLTVNTTDAVHVYSDETHIWLQLRRNVPTEVDIARPSFKYAMCLNIGTAEKLGGELIKIAKRNKAKQKVRITAAGKQSKPKPKQPAQIKQ